MATAFSVSPILRLRRSAQSATYTMTVAWQTIYQNTQPYAWMFSGGKIDLSNMVAGDHIDLRVSTRQIFGGAWQIEDIFDYDDAQPTNKQKGFIGTILDTFGVLVELRQTAGALISCYCEFYEAIR